MLSRIPAFQLGRRLGRPLVLPASLTFNVLYACNSRCKTCFIYENHARVLSVDEYERILRSVGSAARWVTITGGEPFLRADLGEIALSVVRNCRPAVLNIPTNGTFPTRVERVVADVARALAPNNLIINLSIDEVEQAHDALRRFEGNWDLAMHTAEVLRDLKRRHPNLVFGINTVVSRFNEHRIGEIAERVEQIAPDSYVAEVAGQRVELGTSRSGITPSAAGVIGAIGVLRTRSKRTLRLVEALVAALREEYYRVLERYTVERRQILPCYAAITSAHIMPEGKVWACCVLGEELGDLRETDYDFPTIWYGAQARQIRERIKRERCACTLSNQTYLNVLVDPRSLVRAGARATELLARSHAAAVVPGSAPWQSASS